MPVDRTVNLNLFISHSVVVPKFHPEYGRYMLESTPGAPYTGSIPDLLSVEKDMRYRLVRAGLSSTTGAC